MYVCMYVHTYICMCTCVCIYVCTYVFLSNDKILREITGCICACSCWDEAPEKRPSIDELVLKFTKLSKVSTTILIIDCTLFTLHNCT